MPPVRIIFLLLFSIIGAGISAQKIVIADSLSGEPLPYASIYLKDTVIYSSPEGTFFYRKKYGKIFIIYDGYKSKKIIPEKDTILLSPLGETLPDIIVTYHKPKKTEKLKNNAGATNFYTKTACFILIKPKQKLINKTIVSFGFEMAKHVFMSKEIKRKRKKLKHLVQYCIYENNHGKPGKLVYASSVFSIPLNKKGIVEHHLDKEIILTENGLFFSIKSLGIINEKKEVVKINIRDKKESAELPLSIAKTKKTSIYYDAESYFTFNYLAGNKSLTHVKDWNSGKPQNYVFILTYY